MKFMTQRFLSRDAKTSVVNIDLISFSLGGLVGALNNVRVFQNLCLFSN